MGNNRQTNKQTNKQLNKSTNNANPNACRRVLVLLERLYASLGQKSKKCNPYSRKKTLKCRGLLLNANPYFMLTCLYSHIPIFNLQRSSTGFIFHFQIYYLQHFRNQRNFTYLFQRNIYFRFCQFAFAMLFSALELGFREYLMMI